MTFMEKQDIFNNFLSLDIECWHPFCIVANGVRVAADRRKQ